MEVLDCEYRRTRSVLWRDCKILWALHLNQIYSGITCGRVLNGELYTWKLYKLINLSMID